MEILKQLVSEIEEMESEIITFGLTNDLKYELKIKYEMLKSIIKKL